TPWIASDHLHGYSLRRTDGRGWAVYQSLLSTSPPAGVKAAAQVAAFMPADRLRTLPSARATCMALWGVEARRRSHGPGFWRKFAGRTRNLEAVPVRKMTPSRP